jgi:hypothetical protein
MVAPGTDKKFHHKNSASSLRRKQLCPGSAFMELDIPDDEDDSDAARGTQLHKIMESIPVDIEFTKDGFEIHNAMPALKADDIDQVEFCLNVHNEIISKYGKPKEVLDEFYIEYKSLDKRYDNITGGYLDRIYVYNDFSVINDYKFGFKPVKAAASNIQVADYALLAHNDFGHNKVIVYITQPPRS